MPAERILINADLYSPPAPGADPPAVTPNMRSLVKLPAARASRRRVMLGTCAVLDGQLRHEVAPGQNT